MKKAQLSVIIGLVLVFAVATSFAANPSEFVKDDMCGVKDGKKLFDVYYEPDYSFVETGCGTMFFSLVQAFTEYGRQVEMDRWDDFPSNCYYVDSIVEFDLNGHYRPLWWCFKDHDGNIIKEVDIFDTDPPWQTITPNSIAEHWERLCCQHA